MKTKITTLALLLFISLSAFAQQGINYKALIRDNAGNAVANQLIVVEFDILESGTTSVYQEQHTPTTDVNGIIVLTIGQGTVLSGDFNTIAWGANSHFLNVQVNTGSGLTDMGTTEFMAVPYAKYADQAGNTFSGSFTDLTNVPVNLDTDSTDDVVEINDLVDAKRASNSYYMGQGAGDADDGSFGLWNVGIGYNALHYNTSDYNTAIGFRALYYNTTGYDNTATGSEALSLNTVGGENTATGSEALSLNTVGYKNTATGSNALSSNTEGYQNTATGSNALFSNTTGNSNTATGHNALSSNTTGYDNTSNGRNALSSNTTGHSNTSNGSYALSYNTIGISNTANGYQALYKNTTGNKNTANGFGALYSNTTGSRNVALGYLAGYSETGGSKLYIANSSTSTPLIYGEFDTKKLVVNGQLTALNRSSNSGMDLIVGGTSNTALGDNGYISSNPNYASSDLFLRSYDAVFVQLDYDNNESGNFEIINGANVVVFDVNEAGNVRVNGSLVHASDRRLKKDIAALPYGLSEILQLQPKAYNWKDRNQGHKSLGLIAQEVQPIISEVVSKADDEQQTLGISYTELIPVLINAIKEQQEIIQTLSIRIKTLEDKQDSTTNDTN